MEKIFVFIYPENSVTAIPAGIFNYDPSELVGNYAYGNLYRRNSAFPVSPDLLIREDNNYSTSEFSGLFSAFRDSLPDYWGRAVYSSINKRPINTIGEHELLLAGGASRIGNLDFRTSVDSSEPLLHPPEVSNLPGLVAAARAVQLGQEVEPEYKLIFVQGSTMGGMRPKCTVEDDNKLYLAKFPAINDSFSVVNVEAATMALAGLSGITVPDFHLQSIGSDDVFMIERFDRQYSAKQQGYFRKGYHSALTLLHKHESDRGISYLDMAVSLREAGDTRGAKEIFKRMVFNIAVKNKDDHSKNHGFFYSKEGRHTLSPAFDITPTPSIDGVETEFDLALNVGKQGRLATIENALSNHHVFGLTMKDAENTILDVLNATSEWRDTFEKYNVSERDIEKFSYTFDSIQERLEINNALEGKFGAPGW